MAKKGVLVALLLAVPADSFSVTPSVSKNTITIPRTIKPVYSMAKNTRGIVMNAHMTRLRAQEDENDEIESMASVPLSSQIEDIAEDIVQAKKLKSKSKNKNSPMALLSNMGDSLAKKHAVLAATIMLFLSVFMLPLPSLAITSGGRVGGSFGSSGGGYSGGTTYSAPARSSIGSSSYYGQGYNRGFSSGYRNGYYSRPSVVVGQSYASPFYSPFYAPTFYSRPSGVIVSSGGGFFDFVTFVGLALAAVFTFSNFGAGSSSAIQGFDTAVGGALGPGVSVAEISVALDVPNRDDPNSILSVLNRLANTARTDSRAEIQSLTSQVALELLRRKNQIVASSSKSTHFRDTNKASSEFNKWAVKERSKFERETLSRYGGVDYGRSSEPRNHEYSPKATKAVVTLLVAIEGDQTKLPKIRSQSDVEEALSLIASNSKVGNCLQSAEILWTPEERTETLSMRDVVSDYPELRSI